VLDASKAVGVASSLRNTATRAEFAVKYQAEQAALREAHASATQAKPLLTLTEARSRKPAMAWENATLPKPSFTGTRVLSKIALDELVPLIDWSPFFHAWELRGRYPRILEDPSMGAKARELWADAQRLLERILRENLFEARAVYGFFPANSQGDDVLLYTDESRRQTRATLHFLRQQMDKPEGQQNHCLADYIQPVPANGQPANDYLGLFASTAGFGVEALCREFESKHDDYNSIMAKALADRFAEALAEYLHRQARIDWGFGQTEKLSIEDLHREKYRGVRPAPGYPACPDHSEKQLLWELLAVEKTVGIRLTESCAMLPASSVSGYYFAHPEAKYFGVGKIGRDQLADYQLRKGMPMAELERWLAPNLD